MSLRVLHLSTFDDSGAARGAVWLHDAFLRSGVESSVIVGRKSGADSTIHAVSGPFAGLMAKARMRLDQLPLHRYDKTDEAFWTIGWFPSGIDRQIRAFRPDIVHLHWIGNGFLSIDALKRIRCPIVWTLRDMWAFTGGCHYTAGCERYRVGCGSCPQLRSNVETDLSRSVWTRKLKHWRNVDLWLVPISEWLGDCARTSALFQSTPIEIIPNGVDVRKFQPFDRAESRLQWNISPNRQIVVFGAVNATRDPRKGFRELVSSLRHLSNAKSAQPVQLVVFGDLKPEEFPDIGVETRHVGFIEDDRKLATLYSAADVAVVPSLQEAFGKTVIEAMACATPVVAFDSGGPRDIIDHRVDGYLAAPFDAEDLARGIMWCLNGTARSGELGRLARAKVESAFDIDVVARRYFALYRRVLALTQQDRAVADHGGQRLRPQLPA